MKLTNPININDIQSKINVITIEEELTLIICHSIKYLISQLITYIEFNIQKQENISKKIILLK